jgi:L-erythro-3,5-diaminohexanoate dehydrogenase
LRLDPSPTVWANELGVHVELLSLDAASFRQLRETYPGEPGPLRAALLEICAERGKVVNPVTGSGGMLVGRVSEVGPDHPCAAAPGTRVATLVSLTLTPLWLEDISGWDGASEIVPARGHAIVFARSPFAVVPDDLELRTVLSVLDVAGAPALLDRHVRSGMRVAVIGGSGKSGSLACVAAREAGASEVAALVPTLADVRLVESVGAARPVVGDATDPVRASQAIVNALGGPADLTAVCVDVADAEGAALLSTDDGGTVIFFSMATSFTRAALGAEGLGADLTLLIGNGYVPGHAERALSLVRDHAPLRALFDWRAGVGPRPGGNG